jgi:hypothetical protein
VGQAHEEQTESADGKPSGIAHPVGYPRAGTFGELLNWHLDWGTRPGCSTATPNEQWVRSHFAQLVHEEGLALDSATRSLRNWTNRGKLPQEHDDKKWDRICAELFGDDPNLRRWKDDLTSALRHGRSHASASRRLKGDNDYEFEVTVKLWGMLINLFKIVQHATQKYIPLPAIELMDDDERDEFLKEHFTEVEGRWIKAFGKMTLERFVRENGMDRAAEIYRGFRLHYDPLRVIWRDEFNSRISAIFPIADRMFDDEKFGHDFDDALRAEVEELRLIMRDAEIAVAAELERLRP